MKKLTGTMILFAVLFVFAAIASADTPWIFGMHDPGGEGEMVAKGKRGWIVFTEAIGHDPSHWGGRNYSRWSDDGHSVIVRLNNGYGSSGTLPFESHYGDFATRCGNFVESSQGAHIWIIGNEPNMPREWPGNIDENPDTGEAITVERYVRAYQQCRNNIRSRPGHENDIVCPAPSGTWAPPYWHRGIEGFLDYWVNILNTLGPNQVDALAIHAYTHGSDSDLIFSDVKMNPPYSDIYYHFWVYKNYMWAIPPGMRDKPLWITESNQTRQVSGYNWDPSTTDWVQNAYFEIDQWNSNPAHQKIRGLILFRWADAWEGDKNYCIPCVSAVVEDWRAALENDYRWAGSQPGYAEITGTANLQGRTNHAGVTVSVGSFQTRTDRDGEFHLRVPAGSYDITASMDGYLDAARSDQFSGGTVLHLPSITLPSGDVNGDGEVNIFDLVIVGVAFGSSPPSNPQADINGDGVVDILDVVLVSANFYKRGPVPWQ